jgi:hypothetical protein
MAPVRKTRSNMFKSSDDDESTEEKVGSGLGYAAHDSYTFLARTPCAIRLCCHNSRMLRDKSLIPLSHQHQHALALCVRLDRALQAGEVELGAWQAEIAQIFEQEIGFHFAAEEKELFPAAMRFPEVRHLVEELAGEHGALRDLFSRAATGTLDAAGLQTLVDKLATHIRKEERQLFEEMQKRMSAQDLLALGTALEKALAEASKACILPTDATRLRPKR